MNESVRTDAPDWRCEHFIPLRKADLVRLLAGDADLSAVDRQRFLQFCRLLEATFHYEFHERLEELKACYAPFNPDSVTHEALPLSDEERALLVSQLFEKFSQLMERANFRRLSRGDIERAVGAASDWGVRLRVDFDSFERLEVYSRGDAVERRARRHWRNFYRSREIDVPIFERLVVIFRLRDGKWLQDTGRAEWVYMKIFKSIPKQDVDMLLPTSQFKMTLVDRGRTILPTLSGIVIAAFKIVKGALLLPWFGILMLVGGTIGYGVKSILGYLHTKDKYQLSLTRNLYYHNLDNNAGVLFRMLDDAEEQEFREAILAYALLRRKAGDEGWTEADVDRASETYLRNVLGFAVDFDVGDAIGKLERLGCAEKRSGGRWHAVPLAHALSRLDKAWDAYFH